MAGITKQECKRKHYEAMRQLNSARDPYAFPGTEECHRCKSTKDLSQFGRDLAAKDGLRTVCRACRNATQRSINRGAQYESYKTPVKEIENKTCTSCQETKPILDFPKQQAGKAGRNACCKTCLNFKVRLKNYNITRDEFEALLVTQEGKCAGCSVPLRLTGRSGSSVVVDHCHETRAVRGLLCNTCNRAMGMLGDNSSILSRLANYLLENT